MLPRPCRFATRSLQRERLDPRLVERPRVLFFAPAPRPDVRLALVLRARVPPFVLTDVRETLLERPAVRGRVERRPYSPRWLVLSPAISLGISRLNISFCFDVRLLLFLVLGISRSPCCHHPRGAGEPRHVHDACHARQRLSAAG